eukprot:g23867.t1
MLVSYALARGSETKCDQSKQIQCQEYPKLRTAADLVLKDGVRKWTPWREVLAAAERAVSGAWTVAERWRRRCAELQDDLSPVALACWHPFEAPIPGERHACLSGLSPLGRASPSSFWHFMRGFFVEEPGGRVQGTFS